MTIDYHSWWWRQGRAGIVIFTTLLVVGNLFEPLQTKAWNPTRANQPELNFKDLGDNLGQGTLLGVFGGFRNILADFAWLRRYTFWEQRDLPNTIAMLNLATTLDPQLQVFWDDGSRQIAYDIPSWLEFERPRPTTDAEKKAFAEEYTKFNHDQAVRGLEFLDRGLQFLPNNYKLLLDKAEIYQNRLANEPGALEEAAEQYKLAAAATKQVYYPMRQSIRLLWSLGDKQHQFEAYDYLKSRYPNLPEDAPDAQKSVMWDTLQAMEQVLKIPDADRTHFPKPANYSSDPDFELLPDTKLGDS